MNEQPALSLLLIVGLIQFWLMPTIAWVLLRGQRDTAARFWFAGTACYAGTASLFALQLAVPAVVVMMLGLALVPLMLLFLCESLRRELQDGPTPWRWIIGLTLANMAMLLVIEHLADFEVMRVAQLCIVSILDIVCVLLLATVSRRHRSLALVFVLAGFTMVIITNLLRIHGYLSRGESPSLLTYTPVGNLSFVVNYLSVVLYSFGYWGFVIEKNRAALIREVSERARAQAEEASAREREQSARQTLREREELIAQLAHMQRAAQAGALSASIAHEVNQPLASIRLSVEQAIECVRSGIDRERIDPLLDRIAAENRRAANIIATLRDIFRGRQGEPEARSIDEVILAMCTLMQRRAGDEQVALTTELNAPVQVRVGAGELEHVVLNLLSNALDALRDARVPDARIRVSTTVQDRWATLQVSDNGPGVSDAMRPRIFDLFIGSGASGLGLGLWLSRYIVERHGGSIELQESGSSEPKVDCPVGASFLVRLAVAQASTPS